MRLFIILFWVLSLPGLSFSQAKAKTNFGLEMANILEHTKVYTLALIEQMPEAQWDFRPAEGVRTFREQVEHMATVLDFQTNFVLRGNTLQNDPAVLQQVFGEVAGRNSGKTQQDLKKQLAQLYDVAIKRFQEMRKKDFKKSYHYFFLPDQPTRSLQTSAMALRDHLTHHRGQLVVYLRLKEIKPAAFIAF